MDSMDMSLKVNYFSLDNIWVMKIKIKISHT